MNTTTNDGQRRKRPFYIIAHNPNTIEEAKEYLDMGVNALEPDVVFADGQFYVSHLPHLSYSGVPRLEDYLQTLKQLLLDGNYNLALLIFDMKESNFDPNALISFIKKHFSGGPCDEIAMLLTCGDDHSFVSRYNGTYPNVGIGVDESNTPPSELSSFFKKAGHQNFCYADGITTILTKPGVFENITQAQGCRDQNVAESFKLVYTWVLENEASMRKYLDSYIDGIFVDNPGVKTLKHLLSAPPYNEAFELARCGYNPFTAPPMPRYLLRVKTADKLWAGTDATIVFALKSTSGVSLKSLPFNGKLSGALERNSLTTIAMEGVDLGEIECLLVDVLSEDFSSDWLPERVVVESRLLREPVTFIFNGEGRPETWVTKAQTTFTLFPEKL